MCNWSRWSARLSLLKPWTGSAEDLKAVCADTGKSQPCNYHNTKDSRAFQTGRNELANACVRDSNELDMKATSSVPLLRNQGVGGLFNTAPCVVFYFSSKHISPSRSLWGFTPTAVRSVLRSGEKDIFVITVSR